MVKKKVTFKVYINTKNHSIYNHKRNFDFEKNYNMPYIQKTLTNKNNINKRLNSVSMWCKNYILSFQFLHATSPYYIFKNKYNHT